jgi:hypothetical protein
LQLILERLIKVDARAFYVIGVSTLKDANGDFLGDSNAKLHVSKKRLFNR